MDYCPNCGRLGSGRFCQFCGYDTFRNGVPQQTQYVPRQYQPPIVPPQIVPPVAPHAEKSPNIKFGTILLIICIVGIILSLIVPWIIFQREDDEGNIDSFSFNFNLDLVDGDEDEWGSDEFTVFDGYDDYLKGTIGQSFLGLILSIIIAIILIIIGFKSSAGRYSGNFFHGMSAIIGASLLVPGMMVIVSGINFLGLDIIEIHSNAIYDEAGYDITSEQFYPSAYLMLILGFIICIIALKIIKKELLYLTLHEQTSQKTQQIQTSPPLYPGGGIYG